MTVPTRPKKITFAEMRGMGVRAASCSIASTKSAATRPRSAPPTIMANTVATPLEDKFTQIPGLVQTVRGLYKWAVEAEHVTFDPTVRKTRLE